MQNYLFLANLGGGEIFVILVIILIFFGGKRIPELARALGKGIREFKDAQHGVEREIREGLKENPQEKKPVAENKIVESKNTVETGFKPVSTDINP